MKKTTKHLTLDHQTIAILTPDTLERATGGNAKEPCGSVSQGSCTAYQCPTMVSCPGYC